MEEGKYEDRTREIGYRRKNILNWVEAGISMMSLIGSLNQSELFLITVIKNHYLKIIYFVIIIFIMLVRFIYF